MIRVFRAALAAICGTVVGTHAEAMLTTFFSPDQIKVNGPAGVTSDTIYSGGYSITYTMDKLWSASPGGPPTGRFTSVNWPTGIQAQAVTVPPPGVTDYKARFTLRRTDNAIFDLTSFTAKLLANTAGAGAHIEVMPLLNGEDAFNDPVMFQASGFGGQSFYYDEYTPAYLGNTSLLKGYDTYKMGLYVDFALMSLTLADASVAGDANGDGVVDSVDFGILASHYGMTSGPTSSTGDFNFDGKINTLDFNILSGNFSEGVLVGSTPVPEPAAAVMLPMMLCGGKRRR